MLTLALENSSAMSSVAVCDGSQVLVCEECIAEGRAQEMLFVLIRDTLSSRNMDIADIEQYVVGRGPGNYTGMRISFAMAQAMALPGGAEVFAVSSGCALALDYLQKSRQSRVMVVGDARRGVYWAGIFRKTGPQLELERDWDLLTAEELQALSADRDLAVISPEMERLLGKLPLADWFQERLVADSSYPNAARLAEIAFQRRQNGIDPEPLEPLYMHPAV